MIRVGTGYDSHRLAAGRPLILGGVAIPHPKGPVAHSDGDALAHALIDAMLGAAAEGDIGTLFPDSDPKWKGADSLKMLAQTSARLAGLGWRVVNTDATVIAQEPKLGPHIPAIRGRLARALGLDVSRVSVKAKTNEGLDAIGRCEGIAAQAVVLMEKEGPEKESESEAKAKEESKEEEAAE